MFLLYIILILFIIFLLYLKFGLNLKIKWNTFRHKGFVPLRGNFGLYCYTGNQGKGKTYSLAEYVYDNKDCVYFTNIKNIKTLHYSLKNDTDLPTAIYYKGFDGLVDQKKLLDSGVYDDIIKDKQLIFIYDELFTELQRNTTLSLEVQDFLCQLRKRKIIFLTTAQVWSEIPLYFRKMCRYQINCNMIPLIITGILIKEFRDAENMKWNNETQEHDAPTLEMTITKTRKVVAQSYDTMERITNAK